MFNRSYNLPKIPSIESKDFNSIHGVLSNSQIKNKERQINVYLRPKNWNFSEFLRNEKICRMNSDKIIREQYDVSKIVFSSGLFYDLIDQEDDKFKIYMDSFDFYDNVNNDQPNSPNTTPFCLIPLSLNSISNRMDQKSNSILGSLLAQSGVKMVFIFMKRLWRIGDNEDILSCIEILESLVDSLREIKVAELFNDVNKDDINPSKSFTFWNGITEQTYEFLINTVISSQSVPDKIKNLCLELILEFGLIYASLSINLKHIILLIQLSINNTEYPNLKYTNPLYKSIQNTNPDKISTCQLLRTLCRLTKYTKENTITGNISQLKLDNPCLKLLDWFDCDSLTQDDEHMNKMEICLIKAAVLIMSCFDSLTLPYQTHQYNQDAYAYFCSPQQQALPLLASFSQDLASLLSFNFTHKLYLIRKSQISSISNTDDSKFEVVEVPHNRMPNMHSATSDDSNNKHPVNIKVRKISGSDDVVFLLLEDGYMYEIYNRNNSELLNTFMEQFSLKNKEPINKLLDDQNSEKGKDVLITDVATNRQSSHVLITTNSGDCYSWCLSPTSNYGKLGHDKKQMILRPSRIQTFVDLRIKIQSVACGAEHSLFLETTGCIWSSGKNNNGQLGLGDTRERMRPIRISELHDVEMIAADENQSICVKRGSICEKSQMHSFGIVYTWGATFEPCVRHPINWSPQVDQNMRHCMYPKIIQISINENHFFVLLQQQQHSRSPLTILSSAQSSSSYREDASTRVYSWRKYCTGCDKSVPDPDFDVPLNYSENASYCCYTHPTELLNKMDQDEIESKKCKPLAKLIATNVSQTLHFDDNLFYRNLQGKICHKNLKPVMLTKKKESFYDGDSYDTIQLSFDGFAPIRRHLFLGWTIQKSAPTLSKPFVLEVSIETMKLLSNILRSCIDSCIDPRNNESSDGENIYSLESETAWYQLLEASMQSNKGLIKLSEDKICLTISTLHLLSVQLYACNQENIQLTPELIRSLKLQIILCCCGLSSMEHNAIRSAAFSCLVSGYNVLNPDINDKISLLFHCLELNNDNPSQSSFLPLIHLSIDALLEKVSFKNILTNFSDLSDSNTPEFESLIEILFNFLLHNIKQQRNTTLVTQKIVLFLLKITKTIIHEFTVNNEPMKNYLILITKLIGQYCQQCLDHFLGEIANANSSQSFETITKELIKSNLFQLFIEIIKPIKWFLCNYPMKTAINHSNVEIDLKWCVVYKDLIINLFKSILNGLDQINKMIGSNIELDNKEILLALSNLPFYLVDGDTGKTEQSPAHEIYDTIVTVDNRKYQLTEKIFERIKPLIDLSAHTDVNQAINNSKHVIQIKKLLKYREFTGLTDVKPIVEAKKEHYSVFYNVEKTVAQLLMKSLLFYKNCTSHIKKTQIPHTLQHLPTEKCPELFQHISIIKRKASNTALSAHQNSLIVTPAPTPPTTISMTTAVPTTASIATTAMSTIPSPSSNEKENLEIDDEIDLDQSNTNSATTVNNNKFIRSITKLLTVSSSTILMEKSSIITPKLLAWLKSDQFKQLSTQKHISFHDNITDKSINQLFLLSLITLLRFHADSHTLTTELIYHLTNSQSNKSQISLDLLTLIQLILDLRRDLIKRHQQSSNSTYKDITNLLVTRCRFLLDETELNSKSMYPQKKRKPQNLTDILYEMYTENKWRWLFFKYQLSQPRNFLYNISQLLVQHHAKPHIKPDTNLPTNIYQHILQFITHKSHHNWYDLTKLRSIGQMKKLQIKSDLILLKDYRSLFQTCSHLLPGVRVAFLEICSEILNIKDTNSRSITDSYFVNEYLQNQMTTSHKNLLICFIRMLRAYLYDENTDSPNKYLFGLINSILLCTKTEHSSVLAIQNGVFGLCRTIMRRFGSKCLIEPDDTGYKLWLSCVKPDVNPGDGDEDELKEINEMDDEDEDEEEDEDSVNSDWTKKLTKGTLVLRGRDWKYGDDDGPNSIGIVRKPPQNGMVRVQWMTNEFTGLYRVGKDGFYDLRLKKDYDESGTGEFWRMSSKQGEIEASTSSSKLTFNNNEAKSKKSLNSHDRTNQILAISIGKLLKLIIHNISLALSSSNPVRESTVKSFKYMMELFGNIADKSWFSNLFKLDKIRNIEEIESSVWASDAMLLKVLNTVCIPVSNFERFIEIYMRKLQYIIAAQSYYNVPTQILTIRILTKLFELNPDQLTTSQFESVWQLFNVAISKCSDQTNHQSLSLHSLNCPIKSILTRELIRMLRSLLTNHKLSIRTVIKEAVKSSLSLCWLFVDLDSRFYAGLSVYYTQKDKSNPQKAVIDRINPQTGRMTLKLLCQPMKTVYIKYSDWIKENNSDSGINITPDSTETGFPYELLSNLADEELDTIGKCIHTITKKVILKTEVDNSTINNHETWINTAELALLSQLTNQNNRIPNKFWKKMFVDRESLVDFKELLNQASKLLNVKKIYNENDIQTAILQLTGNTIGNNVKSSATDINKYKEVTIKRQFPSRHVKSPKISKKFSNRTNLSSLQSSRRYELISNKLSLENQNRILEIGFSRRDIAKALDHIHGRMRSPSTGSSSLMFHTDPSVDLIVLTILQLKEHNNHDNDDDDDDDDANEDDFRRCFIDERMESSRLFSQNYDIDRSNVDDDEDEEHDSVENVDHDASEDAEYLDNKVISDKLNCEKMLYGSLDKIPAVCIKEFRSIKLGSKLTIIDYSSYDDSYSIELPMSHKTENSTNQMQEPIKIPATHIRPIIRCSINIGDCVTLNDYGKKKMLLTSSVQTLSFAIVRQILLEYPDIKVMIEFVNGSVGKFDVTDLQVCINKNTIYGECNYCKKNPVSFPIYICQQCPDFMMCISCYKSIQSKFDSIHDPDHGALQCISLGKSTNELTDYSQLLKRFQQTPTNQNSKNMCQITMETTSPSDNKLFEIMSNSSTETTIKFLTNNSTQILSIFVRGKKDDTIDNVTTENDEMTTNIGEMYCENRVLLESVHLHEHNRYESGWFSIFHRESDLYDESVTVDQKYFSILLRDSDPLNYTVTEIHFLLESLNDAKTAKVYQPPISATTTKLYSLSYVPPKSVLTARDKKLYDSIFSLVNPGCFGDDLDDLLVETVTNQRQSRSNSLQIHLSNHHYLAQDKKLLCNDEGDANSNNKQAVGDTSGEDELPVIIKFSDPDDSNRLDNKQHNPNTKVFVWGLNDKDQLGFEPSSKVKLPQLNNILSRLNITAIYGGSKSLFCLTDDGKVYAAGDSCNGRLGIGPITTENANVKGLKRLTGLDKYFIVKVAVHSGGRHSLALTDTGSVFSWGEGDDGKLGHNSRLPLESPQKIQYFQTINQRVVDIACGSHHSAAIVEGGGLYTWGLGDYGRLGHGDTETKLMPHKVKDLAAYKVIQVACGSRDAQTLALTSDYSVWSWGDGDFGKLGRGGSSGCLRPMRIDSLSELEVVQIECGAQSSFALTESGQIWTWGKGDYYRLGLGSDKHQREPKLIEDLRYTRIVKLAVGALHCLAVSEDGKVYSWGDNDHGQQGNGTVHYNVLPTVISSLENYQITNVACGSSHSIAWTTVGSDTELTYNWWLDNNFGSRNIGKTRFTKNSARVKAGCHGYSMELIACSEFSPIPFKFHKDPLGTADLCDPFIVSRKTDENQIYKSTSTSIAWSSKQESQQDTNTQIQRLPTALSYLISTEARNDEVQQNIIQSLYYNLQILVSRKIFLRFTENVSVGSLSKMEPKITEIPNDADVKDDDESKVSPPESVTIKDKIDPFAYYIQLFDFIKLSHADLGFGARTTMDGNTNNELITLFHEAYQQFLDQKTADDESDSISYVPIYLMIDELRKLSEEKDRHLNLDLSTYSRRNRDFANFLKLHRPSVITRESPHPYQEFCELSGTVSLPSSSDTSASSSSNNNSLTRLVVQFDKQCCTVRGRDVLRLMDKNGTVVAERSGEQVEEWDSKVIVPGDELQWSFNAKGSTSVTRYWGWKFEVRTLNSESKSNSRSNNNPWPVLGTELEAVSNPSIKLIESLLSDNSVQHEKIIRLLKYPYCCIQLIRSLVSVAFCKPNSSSNYTGHSSEDKGPIGMEERIWAIKTILAILKQDDIQHIKNLFLKTCNSPPTSPISVSDDEMSSEEEEDDENTDFHKDCVAASKLPDDLNDQTTAQDKYAVMAIICTIKKCMMTQFKYENPDVKSGKQLCYTRFLKTTLELACFIELDNYESIKTDTNWSWFRNFCMTHRVSIALTTDSQIPKDFLREIYQKYPKEFPDPDVELEENEVKGASNFVPQTTFSECVDIQKSIMQASDYRSIVQWFCTKPQDWNRISGVIEIAMQMPTFDNQSPFTKVVGDGFGTIAPPYSVWTWGHNHRGQLGGLEGGGNSGSTCGKVKVPVRCEQLKAVRPRMLAGGEQSLFAVSVFGRVYACGYSNGGRLGIKRNSNSNLSDKPLDCIHTPVLVHSGGLDDKKVLKLSVNSGGKHCLALCAGGLVYSWGESEDHKLGLAPSDFTEAAASSYAADKSVPPTLVQRLLGRGIVDVAAGGAHSAVITKYGELLTWGKGRYGRLGHGNADDVAMPKVIESLRGHRVISVACGSGDAQTLCVTLQNKSGLADFSVPAISGEIESNHSNWWMGWLKNEERDQSEIGIEISTSVWSWGDGDYGKLGCGGFEICKSPTKIDALECRSVVKVDCGSQFSLALTSTGSVYSWGKGDYFRLGHGTDCHVRRPERVMGSLSSEKVTDVSCGSLHCVCVTERGNVYSWGDNDEGQLGDGSTTSNSRPRLVEALVGRGVNRVACGSAHSVAWIDPEFCSVGCELQRVRSKEGSCDNLEQFSIEVPDTSDPPLCAKSLIERVKPIELAYRFRMLSYWSELLCVYVPFLQLNNPSPYSNIIRNLLLPEAKESIFRLALQSSMVGSMKHGPEIKVNRLHASAGTPAGRNILDIKNKSQVSFLDTGTNSHEESGSRTHHKTVAIEKTVFGQVASKLLDDILRYHSKTSSNSRIESSKKLAIVTVPSPECLLLPSRVWKVKLIGESVDDCGGGYSESITEMCDELQNGNLPFLKLSPDKDCFVINSDLQRSGNSHWLIFLGLLLGISIRTNQPLSLKISDLIWMILSGQSVVESDLELLDKELVHNLKSLEALSDTELESLSLSLYTTVLTDGREVSIRHLIGLDQDDSNNEQQIVTHSTLSAYISAVLTMRIHEFDNCCNLIRRGMALVIPLPLIGLFSFMELESMICGNGNIPIEFLRKITLYRGAKKDDPLIMWFWEIMNEMTNEVRSLFLRFVWGRTRLPRYISDLRGKEFVIQVLNKYSPADNYLPEAYTCFFLLKMPNYSCKDILREKLLYAIHFCKSIDIDDYARIALNPDSLPMQTSSTNREGNLAFTSFGDMSRFSVLGREAHDDGNAVTDAEYERMLGQVFHEQLTSDSNSSSTAPPIYLTSSSSSISSPSSTSSPIHERFLRDDDDDDDDDNANQNNEDDDDDDDDDEDVYVGNFLTNPLFSPRSNLQADDNDDDEDEDRDNQSHYVTRNRLCHLSHISNTTSSSSSSLSYSTSHSNQDTNLSSLFTFNNNASFFLGRPRRFLRDSDSDWSN